MGLSNSLAGTKCGLALPGIDALQQSVMGQSKTNPTQEAQSSTEQPPHEAAVDNMHPEQVSEYMRDKYKSTTAEEDREDKAKK